MKNEFKNFFNALIIMYVLNRAVLIAAGITLRGKKSCGTKKRGIKQIFAVHILLNLRKTSRVRYSRFLVA